VSTRIYHGFRFKSSSIIALQDFFMRWRETLKSLHRNELAAVLARIATDTLDRSFTNPELQVGKTPWSEAFSDVMDRQKTIKKTGSRDPEVDFDFDVSILPYGRKIYGIIYSERGDWRDLFLEQPEIEDFSYWNNSDRPDTISAREWNHRNKTWNTVLGSRGIPALRGFSAQCTEETLYVECEDVLEAVKPHVDRVFNRAKDVIIGAEMYRRMQEIAEPDRQKHIFETFWEAHDWMKTPEAKLLLQAKISELSEKLPRVITKELLLSKITPEIISIAQDTDAL
jgi:hypothetical protein